MNLLKASLPLVFLMGVPSLWSQEPLDVDTLPEQKSKNLAMLDAMLTEKPAAPTQQNKVIESPAWPQPKFSLLDMSLILKAAAGASSAQDSELAQLQTGSHDPRRRGFTFQGGELSLSGSVDSYFKAEMHANFSESAVELEEAFITTTNLPASLELEVGYFLTEFGRNNPKHSHEWDFIDQPLTVGRFFGGEGQRASGFRLGGLLPVSWLSEWHVGMQSPTGGLSPSFRSTATTTVGGRPTVTRETKGMDDMLALIRWVNGTSISQDWETQFGLSAMTGPNSTGPDANTTLLGADLVLRWTSPKQRQGYPYFRLEAEAIQRSFEAASGVQNGLSYTAEDLDDWAWLVQGVYGFYHRWSAGLRMEQTGGAGASFAQLRSADPSRSDRTRISPILTFKPSEFSKASLQYNHDRADHLTDKTQSSVWLSVEVLLGSHPAHNF